MEANKSAIRQVSAPGIEQGGQTNSLRYGRLAVGATRNRFGEAYVCLQPAAQCAILLQLPLLSILRLSTLLITIGL